MKLNELRLKSRNNRNCDDCSLLRPLDVNLSQSQRVCLQNKQEKQSDKREQIVVDQSSLSWWWRRGSFQLATLHAYRSQRESRGNFSLSVLLKLRKTGQLYEITWNLTLTTSAVNLAGSGDFDSIHGISNLGCSTTSPLPQANGWPTSNVPTLKEIVFFWISVSLDCELLLYLNLSNHESVASHSWANGVLWPRFSVPIGVLPSNRPETIQSDGVLHTIEISILNFTLFRHSVHNEPIVCPWSVTLNNQSWSRTWVLVTSPSMTASQGFHDYL